MTQRERPRRSLVPTPRLANGAGPAPLAAPAEADGERRHAREVLREWARGVDPRSIPGSKLPLVVLGLLGALVAWDFNAIGVLVFEMRADFGFDLVFLATLGSLLGVIGRFVAPVMGFLADRVNRVWMLRIGAGLSVVALALTLGARSVATLVIARALAGIALVIGGGAAMFPLLTDWYPSSARARVFAVMGVAGPLGGIFGPLLAGWLAGTAGWRAAMLPELALAGLALLGTLFLREPPRGYMDRLESGASEEVARREQRPPGWSESWRAASSIVTLRRLWIASPFLLVGGTGALIVLAAYFVDVLHLTPGQRGLITGAGGAVALLSVAFAGPIADALLQRRPERVMSIGGTIPILQAAMFGLLAFFPLLAVSIPLSLVVAGASGILGIAGFALMSIVTPARVRGLGLQIGNLFEIPALIAIPIVVGFAQTWGLQRGMLVFVPLLVVGGLIVMSASSGVARDMRAARAAAMADEEAERSRRERLDTMVIVRDLDVTYDGTQVLFGVDLDIGSGEIVALLGTNGAGKSTLLRAIVGIQQASSGAIIVDGQDVTHAPPHENARRGIMMVPGGQGVFPTLTVAENLATAARALGLPASGPHLEEVLALFPALRARFGELAGNLSGGEQQMLAMGQALLARPRLLMIDELSLGLAPALVEQLIETVRAIHASGTTVVLVEQSLNVALTIAERAVFMEKGTIRFDGPATDLLRRPDLVRSVFMGGALGGAPPRGARRVPRERETVLRAEDIAVRFGGVQAVRNASLDAAAGEIVGIIGPNGAGKTTLFDVIAGGTVPDAGRVLLHGEDVTLLPAHRRARAGLGRSFQTARLFGSLTVRECIAVAMERHARVTNPVFAAVRAPRWRKEERRIQRRVEGLLYLLGLNAYADKFVSELSTGTRRAVDIACIMAAEPSVVLLDEPSSGLSQAESEALAPLLTRVVRDTGCALVVIEHDLPMIASIADRLVAMDVGEVIATGTPGEVLADDTVVRSYLAATDEVIQRSDLHNLTTTRTG